MWVRFEWFDLTTEKAEFEHLLKLGIGTTQDRLAAAIGLALPIVEVGSENHRDLKVSAIGFVEISRSTQARQHHVV